MTKAYSKISRYDRPHVYVFVLDKKISTLESVSKISGYGRKFAGYVWTQAVFVKKIAFSQISGYVWMMPMSCVLLTSNAIIYIFPLENNRPRSTRCEWFGV